MSPWSFGKTRVSIFLFSFLFFLERVFKRLLLISETELAGATVFLLMRFQASLARAQRHLMTAAARRRETLQEERTGLGGLGGFGLLPKVAEAVLMCWSSAALNDSLMRVPHFSKLLT